MKTLRSTWRPAALAITAILFGCAIPGVPRPAADATPAGRIHVTDALRCVNGTTNVPIGLFGVHATKLTPDLVADWGVESVRLIDRQPTGTPHVVGTAEIPAGIQTVVETFFDRYQPARMLTDPNWKRSLVTLAHTYGSNAMDGVTHHIEFWNEPFLNWATRPGVNYDGRYYMQTNRAVGAPMTIKGWSQPLDFLIWTQALRLVDITSGLPQYVPNGNYALAKQQLVCGSTNWVEGKPYRVDRLWWGRDTTQDSYWSGKQNSLFYRWMLVPFAQALKETNPSVQLVAGWGFSLRTDDWKAWDVLIQPTIDESILWLDGISEHHYGADTRAVAADYEIAYAYALGKYGKRLRFYNTETGGQLDPQRPDTPAISRYTGSTPDEARAAFTYMVRDIVYLLRVCPDKAVARAQHEARGNPGNGLAFKFLKPLRGGLVSVESCVPDVWCVASLNTTQLCVVVFNDRAAAVAIPLEVAAPAGMTFTSAQAVALDPAGTNPVLRARVELAHGTSWNGMATLAPKNAVEWLFNLEGIPAQARVVTETQFAANALAYRLAAGETVDRSLIIPTNALARAVAARLKIVCDTRTPAVQFNGKILKLPKSDTGITELPVDPAELRATNSITVKGVAPSSVTAISLVLTSL